MKIVVQTWTIEHYEKTYRDTFFQKFKTVLSTKKSIHHAFQKDLKRTLARVNYCESSNNSICFWDSQSKQIRLCHICNDWPV